jgi:hypothetical protein
MYAWRTTSLPNVVRRTELFAQVDSPPDSLGNHDNHGPAMIPTREEIKQRLLDEISPPDATT